MFVPVLPKLVVCQVTASQCAIQRQGAVRVCMGGDQLWLCQQELCKRLLVQQQELGKGSVSREDLTQEP